ncbi:MAG: acyl-CoA dehydrogenase family protein [Hyphomicrobiales bacterium]
MIAATALAEAGRDPFGAAREAAAIARAAAAATDRDGAFPQAGMDALRRTGLLGLIVPVELGGYGATYATAIEIAQILSGACLSTSMLWSMHCQQVAILVDHGPSPLREALLRRVAAGDLLIASVTSEPTKGGHLLSAMAALERTDDGFAIDREAPVVTAGMQADGLLITMRRSPEATPSEIVLVYADRDELQRTEAGGWHTMGMRGTSSVPMHLAGRVPADRLVDPEGGFRRLAVTTMIPAGHLMWTACWLGAAKEAYRQLMHVLRTPELRRGYPLKSDLYAERIARVRLDIDLVEALLLAVAADYERLRATHGTRHEPFEDYAFNIRLNELKVAAAERLFAAVDAIVQLAGLRFGYRVQDETTIERIFRDLRSASLMFANDRLLVTNGKFALVDASL